MAENMESVVLTSDSPEVGGLNKEAEYTYERYVELSARELNYLCKLIDPLTKSALTEYGKCVYFTCTDEGTVEVKYYNQPYVIVGKVKNKSGRKIRDFAILVSTLKSFLSNSFSSLVFVEENGEINLAFGEQLMYVETKTLRKEVYVFEEREANETISYELATYVFKTVGSVLSMTERASEKVIVIKDGTATFNTGLFAASIRSPFSGSERMVIYKQVSDSIAIVSEIAKNDIHYGVSDVLTVKSDALYCEFPAGFGDRVNAFVSPSTQVALQFKADIQVNDKMLSSLVKLVQSLDYLSDVVTVGFDSSNMIVKLSTENRSRTFPYSFKIISGAPESTGDMSMGTGILRVFLDIVGSDVKYSFNTMGLGIKNDIGTFLIRKS